MRDGRRDDFCVGDALRLLALSLTLAACAGTAAQSGGGAPPPAAPAAAGAAPARTTAAPGEVAAVAPGGVLLDTVRAGRFDNGKMWTFEFPPVEYLREIYGFTPDQNWFRRARLGALRIPSCSASFVSPHGLVLTNHHCGRESVTEVTRAGERLLDEGFYARSLAEERRVEEFYADQLIDLVDVTDEVDRALAGTPQESRAEKRDSILESIEERIAREHGGDEAGIVVEMISLYNGGRYSAYVFRRYQDVRLVAAPELQIGFFGGDPDNFTYPRYNLDFSVFRVYDEDGTPLETTEYFPWSPAGVVEDDVVFVIGNPGSTSRLQTVAQLEFRREVQDRMLLQFIRSRLAVLRKFLEENPGHEQAEDIGNDVFSLSNSEKAYAGIVAGLHDPVIMARRRDSERQFREAIAARPELRKQYGELIDRLAELQDEKQSVAPAFGSFLAMTNPDFESATLRRAFLAYQLLTLRQRGAPEPVLAGLREELVSVGNIPAALDEALIQARFEDFVQNYGRDSDIAQAVLQGRSPEGAAAFVRASAVLADSAGTAAALAANTLTLNDAGLRVVTGYLPRFSAFQQALSRISPEEDEAAAMLGRARFEIYGTAVPPDATFSLRLADGVVQGYEYNGTIAPYKTTFHGLYDRYESFDAREEWALPQRWVSPPASFDRSTPLNFVSTADIIGGNSGSPVVNRDLQLVGLIFDGNIESLSGDYIYMLDRPRAVAVDARGILEALDDIYDADRVVLEVTTGRLAADEAEADRIRAGP